MKKFQLPYLDARTSRNFHYYQIPKELLHNEAFRELDGNAKILYSLMLNRSDLSIKTSQENGGFTDENGYVYIIFPIQEIMDYLQCGKTFTMKILKQLEDTGLIERKRVGLGQANRIYVKNFNYFDNEVRNLKNENQEARDNDRPAKSTQEVRKNEEVRNTKIRSSQNENQKFVTRKSEVRNTKIRSSQNENQDFHNTNIPIHISQTERNKNNLKKTDVNQTEKKKNLKDLEVRSIPRARADTRAHARVRKNEETELTRPDHKILNADLATNAEYLPSIAEAPNVDAAPHTAETPNASATNNAGYFPAVVAEMINQDELERNYPEDIENIRLFYNLIVSILSSSDENFRVYKEKVPGDKVRQAFLKLRYGNIVYALNSVRNANIKNKTPYFTTALYDASIKNKTASDPPQELIGGYTSDELFEKLVRRSLKF